MKKSLYIEIIESLELSLEDSKTDAHYSHKAFSSTRAAVHYALANAIGLVKTIKEGRDLKTRKRKV